VHAEWEHLAELIPPIMRRGESAPRKGKDNALACGFAACTGGVSVMLVADCLADPPRSLTPSRLWSTARASPKGSRFLPGEGSSDITPVRPAGNGPLGLVMNRLRHRSFTDLCYG
jgi:hypothetical protein